MGESGPAKELRALEMDWGERKFVLGSAPAMLISTRTMRSSVANAPTAVSILILLIATRLGTNLLVEYLMAVAEAWKNSMKGITTAPTLAAKRNTKLGEREK